MSGRIGSGFGIYSGGDHVDPSTITGLGTPNFVSRFITPYVIGDGIIQDNGTTRGIGRAPIATSYMTFAPATIALSSLNIETSLGVDVAASLSGDIWWNGTNLKFNNGGSVNFLFSDLLGANNGIATLNGSGVVPNDQLPFNLMEFLGNWDASTNTPTLSNTDVGAQGNTYKVSVAGTVDFGAGNITFDVGDWVVNNGTIWEKVDNTDAVTSVNGNLGAVTTPLADVLAQGFTTGANDISIDVGQNVIYNNGLFATTFGTTTLTGNQSILLPDASGTVALTSDIPANIVTGTGTVNFVSKWSAAGVQTDSQIQDNGTNLSIGVVPIANVFFYVNSPTNQNTGFLTVNNATSNAIHTAISGVSLGVNTTNENVGVSGSASASTIRNIGVSGQVTGASAINVAGRFSASGGTLNYSLLLEDGTEGVGKILTSDVNGYASWQTPAAVVTPTLSAVLTAGNVTNGQNIIADFDSVIRTNNATPLNRMALQLFNDTTDYMALGSDLFAPDIKGGSVQLYDNQLRIGVYTGVSQQGVSLQFLESSKEVRLQRNNVASSNYDFYITGSIDLKLGSASGVAKGLLKPTTLTADRTYTLQDASGTLAFLTDIPSTPTLSATDTFCGSNGRKCNGSE
jgi:hypothetical protein